MADTKKCINCGATNPSSNRFCEDCGCDMKKTIPSPIPIDECFCPNGHKVSDPSLGFCTECGEKLTSDRPVPPSPPPTPIDDDPFVEEHGKKCRSCGAMNPESGMFCENCGTALNGDRPEPGPKPTPEPKPPEPPIPYFMRQLTNDDMKR